MARTVQISGASTIVYDDRCVARITPEFFAAAYWQQSEQVPGYAGGRGATLFITHDDDEWVLKHYHRGGIVGRWLDDGFLWLGLARSRAVHEWDILAQLQSAGLPAPQPVAAHCRRFGPFYTADLITRRLSGVQPLSTRLQQRPASRELWRRVGACVAGFHAAGFCHADLSTHNLQVDADDAVYLLDWDRGSRRTAGAWQQQNLARLERSCHKISREGEVVFAAADWQALLEGYREVCRA